MPEHVRRALTLDDDDRRVIAALRAMQGQPLNVCLDPDAEVELIADREELIREGKMMRTRNGLVVLVGWGRNR